MASDNRNDDTSQRETVKARPLRAIKGDDDYGDSQAERIREAARPEPVADQRPASAGIAKPRARNRGRADPVTDVAFAAPQTPQAEAVAPAAPSPAVGTVPATDPIEQTEDPQSAVEAQLPPLRREQIAFKERIDKVTARLNRAVNLSDDDPDPDNPNNPPGNNNDGASGIGSIQSLVRNGLDIPVENQVRNHMSPFSTVVTVGERERNEAAFQENFIREALTAIGAGGIDQNRIPGDLGERVRAVVSYCEQYAPEFILEQLNIMLLTGVPLDTISSRFRVPISQIERWKEAIRVRNRERVSKLRTEGIDDVVGAHLSFFEARYRFGMQMAMATNATINAKAKGIDIAERAHTNMIKYEELAGLYSGLPLRPIQRVAEGDEDGHVRDARELTASIRTIMGQVIGYSVPGDDTAGGVAGDEDQPRQNRQ